MAENQQATEAAPAQTATADTSEFGKLLEKGFKPRGDEQLNEIKQAVQTLAEQALQGVGTISNDAVKTIEAIIAAIDEKLSQQLNLILHHPDFQKLEGSWRGLAHLVKNTETDEMLKIRVLNISKNEIYKILDKFEGTAWDQSPLFKKVYEDEYGVAGGSPYGCLVGDYEFDHSPTDIKMLNGLAQIGASAHAPFIAAAAPTLFGMQSWQDLNNPRDLTKIQDNPAYAAWRSLRASEDSRYLGLCMPRFLSRLPYGAKTVPVADFAFEEDTAGADHGKYTWSNSAFAMATNITRAFKLYGWCARIRGVESGGIVEGLPVHSFPTDDGGVDMKCPTEVSIPDRREAELSKLGLLALTHWKNTDYAAFIGGQSLQKPQEFENPQATANAMLSARLPYLFATCRFAHYLKCMVRDKIGSFKERADMEKWLSNWIQQYVEPDPLNATEEAKARRPLAEAKVEVEAVQENPGYYKSKFWLRPHFQLEGLTVSLRLVAQLPSGKK